MRINCCYIYLEQKCLGFGSSLFGPVEFPFTLPAVTDTHFDREGSKVHWGHRIFIENVNTDWLSLIRLAQTVYLTSVQKQQTGGSPKYSPLVPKYCICELNYDVRPEKETHVVRMTSALACELKSPSCLIFNPTSKLSVACYRQLRLQTAAASEYARHTIWTGLTWETSPSISQGIQCDPACHQKHREYFISWQRILVLKGALYSTLPEKRVPLTLTFLILRLMIDSAANTLSPTADSSMFTPLLPTVSLLPANVSRADIFLQSQPLWIPDRP